MDEGKLARAMAKAGAAEKLGPLPPDAAPVAIPMPQPVSVTAPVQSHDTAQAKTADSLRVKGLWDHAKFSETFFLETDGGFASQIRGLRAKLLAMSNGIAPRVIAVTSGSRSEGKTTVALNLAAALSEINIGRVVVVDGDMLRPTMQMLLTKQPESGLNEILSQNLKLDGRIYETSFPNLDIIPSKPVHDGKESEALLHQNCAALLARLKKLYAFVIIDTPPVFAGSPATMFAKNSDGVLLVARLEKTPKHVVIRATDELKNSGAKVLGCVLTHHRHHVPDFIYRFFGTTPVNYYRYGRRKK